MNGILLLNILHVIQWDLNVLMGINTFGSLWFTSSPLFKESYLLNSTYVSNCLKFTIYLKTQIEKWQHQMKRSAKGMHASLFWPEMTAYLQVRDPKAGIQKRDGSRKSGGSLESSRLIAVRSPKSFKWCKHFAVICPQRSATGEVF